MNNNKKYNCKLKIKYKIKLKNLLYNKIKLIKLK